MWMDGRWKWKAKEVLSSAPSSKASATIARLVSFVVCNSCTFANWCSKCRTWSLNDPLSWLWLLLSCCGSRPTRRSLLLLSLSLCSSKITVKSHDPCIHSLFSHSFLSLILSSFSSLSFISTDFFWPLKCKFVTLFPLRPDKVDLPLHHRHIHSLSVFPPSSLYYRFSKNSFLDQELSSLTNYFAFCPDIKWIAMSFSLFEISSRALFPHWIPVQKDRQTFYLLDSSTCIPFWAYKAGVSCCFHKWPWFLFSKRGCALA